MENKMKKLPFYDYYKKVASQIFNVPYAKVTKKQRTQAKRLSWLKIY